MRAVGLVSRPAGFRRQPLSERCVRLLTLHRSHQANAPIIPMRQCSKRLARVRTSFSRKRAA